MSIHFHVLISKSSPVFLCTTLSLCPSVTDSAGYKIFALSTKVLKSAYMFYFYEGSMFQTSRLQSVRSCASSPDSPFSVKSCLMLSIHLSFDLPFLLLPYTSITITLIYHSSSLLITCPNHFNLLFCPFLAISY